MKKFKYILVSICSLMMLTSCLEAYQDLNTDTEQLGNADPRNVFTGATENFNNNSRGHLTGKYASTMVNMQYLVPSGGPSTGAYILMSKVNERPQPTMPAYSDYFGRVGLRLNYLINTVIPSQSEPERYNNVKAISQILYSYKQWHVLDTYGAAPIVEGFKAQSEGIRTPKYDLYQSSVDGTPMYKKIDADIKAAVELLKASDANQYPLGNNDFFFKGDVQKWIKFANTLRVKMAQRVEKADRTFYESVVNEVLASAANVMSSNEESCIYYHPNDYNNNTDDIQDITKSYCASYAFVNYLREYNDPRLPIMVRRNGFGDGNNNTITDERFQILSKQYPDWRERFSRFVERYQGMRANPDSASSIYQQATLTVKYVNDEGNETTMPVRMWSQAESRYYVKNGGIIGNNNMPSDMIEGSDFYINQDKIGTYTPILTYPEACLMFAEIAIKKGGAVAGKDATAWMREGIKASMEQYRTWATNMYVVAQTAETAKNYAPVTDDKIAAYLARPEFQSATLEKIISQQWINLYMQPEEMWATWKRTGLPKFKDDPMPENGVAFLETIKSAGETVIIPRRNSLPVPNTMNIDNYNSAVEALMKDAKYGSGTDRTEGRIWWDVE